MILALSGKGINPLTGKEFSEAYHKMVPLWSKLPAITLIPDIKESIIKNPQTLLISGTGSGKTVLTPVIALDTTDYKARVIVSMPKRMIVLKAAQFAAAMLDCTLGVQIGYAYRGARKYNADTKIVFVSDGTLMNMLINSQYQSGDVIIIDEAHERKVEVDINLYLIKKQFKGRLVIMSADVDTVVFRNYFKELHLVKLPGLQTMYPVVTNEVPRQQDYINDGIKQIILCMGRPHGNILFFVPTIKDVHNSVSMLRKILPSMKILGIYSDSPDILGLTETQKLIIVATNVAESSITITDVSDVIDSGLEVQKIYTSVTNSSKFIRNYISKAQITQRTGRTGRTCPGTYHMLYQSDDIVRDYPDPMILTQNINHIILRLLYIIQNTSKIKGNLTREFITPLDDVSYKAIHKRLANMKLISNSVVTPLGKITMQLPFGLEENLCLVTAYELHCLKEVSLILSCCNIIKNDVSNIFTVKDHVNLYPNSHQVILEIFTMKKSPYTVKDSIIKQTHSLSSKVFHQTMSLLSQSKVPLRDIRKASNFSRVMKSLKFGLRFVSTNPKIICNEVIEAKSIEYRVATAI